MKKIFFCCICLMVSVNLFSQIDTTGILKHPKGITPSANKEIINEEDDNKIYTTIDKKPKFDIDINKFIAKKKKYPTTAKKNNITGKVMVQYVVEKDGSITNIKTVSPPLGYGLEEEAMRVIKMMPKMQPAEFKGKKVRAYFRIPIVFRLK